MTDALNLKRTHTVDVPRTRERQPAQTEQTLTFDMIALLLILCIAAAYHIQNPLLQFETQFGTAFRNATLQPVIAVLLAVGSALLMGRPGAWRENPLKLGAAAVLIAYTLYMGTAIIGRFNIGGALSGIEQAVFFERLNDASPREALAAHAAMTAILEWLALCAVAVFWQPWTRLSLYRQVVSRQSAPLIVAVLVLAGWEVLITAFSIQEFLLPRPSVIGTAFAETYPRLISAGWNTFQNAFWGFVVGCGAGIVSGIIAARFGAFSRALLPVAIMINAIPIIALAPIFNNWFGALNAASKIAIVAVLTYFPTMISTVKGLTSVDALSLELMTSYAAAPLETFRKLRLPSALPYIFSALKVATTLSMIAAIVSEYFGGSTAGLGYKIRDDAGLFKYPEAWASILMASLFGILFYVVVSAVERALMRWHPSFREK
ncbi:MAG: ABC transporter permease [bacterium]|nr:ABC transporter permease [bacterium]